jgi:hypothetical protein
MCNRLNHFNALRLTLFELANGYINNRMIIYILTINIAKY